ncbi:hypothetical protein HAHE_38910 [Haloferula helveola]|uniref:Uncharacterized protein n=1 Tax=Haloferula helveola TaxID=490095 RepID=A0ABN6H935_9BACT|nr:hypothetical protein HAHE_38910 [Haloferula helveola]
MKTPASLIAAALIGFSSIVCAGAPTTQLTEDVAKSLIAQVLEIRESGIRVANIVEGSHRTKSGFEYRDVRRVTTVHPVVTERGLVRKVRCYDFYWSEAYGWFHEEVRESRGGEEVWIWSEKKGEEVIK